ncbi:DUF4115 domain-containing protein [Aerophototrophica crusticola]|uniref:DUF4115 domain-containing protein n=1 Tax=Aerophototrophica crusticola TaxID=1709002 RepID=A0A858RBS5_9PROT|nr:DUF4115 domain-containing protein [Rhodospirillaceae bacterium B3]
MQRQQDLRNPVLSDQVPPVDTGPGAPRHVGEVLRLRREELGLNLDQLATDLCIRHGYLEAIEQGRWAELPGQAYVTGFLRSYAQALGLEPTQVLARFRQDTANVAQPAELYFPEPVSEGRVPGGAILLVAVLAAAVIYGGWYVMSSADRSVGDLVPPLPDRLSGLIYGDKTAEQATPDPAQTPVLGQDQAKELVGSSQPTAPEIGVTGTNPVPVPNSPAATPPGATTPAPGTPPATPAPGTPPAAVAEADDSEVPQLPEVGQQAAAPAAPAEAPSADSGGAEAPAAGTPPAALPAGGRVFGVAQGPTRVEVRATDDAWIEVRDAKGTTWAARNLRAGDVFRAPDVPGLTLLTGNAAGVSVILDGQELPPLGKKGQVVRNVSLVPADLATRAGR